MQNITDNLPITGIKIFGCVQTNGNFDEQSKLTFSIAFVLLHRNTT